MAEQLGEAVLTVSADTRQLEAGLQRAQQQAQQAGSSINSALGAAAQGSAATIRSIQELQTQLQTLQQRQVRLDVDSTEFRATQQDINRLQQELQGIERRKILIDVDANSITAITTGLQAKLNELQRRQLRVDVDGEEFKTLTADINATIAKLDAVERKLVTVNVDPRSLEALQTRLLDLQRRQLKVDVDSTEFVDLQRQINAAQAELSRINGRKVRVDVDDRSITGITSRIQSQLERLRDRQLKIDVDSSEFVTVSQQISALDRQLQGLDRRRITASVDDRSIVALQTRLQGLRTAYESVDVGSRQFRQLQREIQRTEQELQKVDRTLGNTFRQGATGFGANLLGGLGLGIGAGAAVGGFLKGAIDEAIRLETTTRKLSNTLGPQGAGAALSFVKGLSNETGLSFKTLADGFARFTAAATAANVPLQTQRDLFAAVSRSGQALGLSNDEINGSLLALQQVASKGTVSMEELRQQLGERLPIALSATAKGLGITQAELNRLVESGKLTAVEFFPALTKGLNELTAGANGLETTAQKLGKFQNAWEQLQASFGKNLLPGVTKSVEGLTAALDGLGVVNEAKQLGFSAGLFTGISTEAAQAVADLRRVQEQFNLSDQQARNIFSQAVKDSGARYGISGPIFEGQQYQRLQEALIARSEEFRRKNRDVLSEQKAQEAAINAASQQEAKRTAEKQKQLDITLRENQATLQLRNAQDRLQAARLTPGIDEAGRTRLQNELSLNEKIRDVEAVRLALQRELDKPKGAGDGKPTAQGAPTQNQKTIDDLQGRLNAGRVDVATLRLQNQQADAAALRTQQERIRGQQLEAAAAAAKLNTTKQQTELERQALAAGVEVSRTAQLRLQQEEAVGAALRQQKAAQQALRDETSKPKAQQDRVVLDDLTVRLARANEGVRQAYADAGLSLVQNARAAADALKSAQQSFNSTARGGFQFLTPQLQAQQIAAAQASVQNAVDRGLIRTGIDISTPERLFQVAGFAEQIVPAQKQLEQAIKESTAATAALAKKDWQVYVSVPGQPTFVPLPNT